jgi:hypothetical protein
LSFFRKKPVALERRRSLALKPLRNPNVAWDQAGREAPVVIRIPLQRRPAPKFLVWVASKLARQEPPACRKLELDSVGSFVWQAANGERSVRELIWLLAAEYKLNRKDAEVALLEFLRQLSARNLMAFADLPKGPSSTI